MNKTTPCFTFKTTPCETMSYYIMQLLHAHSASNGIVFNVWTTQGMYTIYQHCYIVSSLWGLFPRPLSGLLDKLPNMILVIACSLFVGLMDISGEQQQTICQREHAFSIPPPPPQMNNYKQYLNVNMLIKVRKIHTCVASVLHFVGFNVL